MKKGGLGVREARRMVQARNVWVCEGECVGCRRRDKPLALTRCHSYMYSFKGGSPSVAKPTTEGHKGEIFFLSLSFSFTDLILALSSWHDACRSCGCEKW